MMLHMAEVKHQIRFTESMPGRVAGWLLAALWIYSMSGVDSHAFSAFPACVVLVAVLLCAVVGVLMGRSLVQMPWLGWLSLALGAFFMVRCLNSYSQVESWYEASTILAGFVYYVAGVYAAQNRNYMNLVLVVGLALLLNVLMLWMARQPWFCIEWTGRAQFTPEGKNAIPMTLFIYKNFSGAFQLTCGLALGGWALWQTHGKCRFLLLAIVLLAVVASFLCQTRAPLFLLPLGILLLWILDTVVELYAGRPVGWMRYLTGFLLLVFLGLILSGLFFNDFVGRFFSDVDSHLRYRIWASACELIPQSPSWGFGAGSLEWEIVPYYNEWKLPNYAHNEYIQVWVDYGVIGIAGMLAVIVLHVVRGCRCIASHQVGAERRALAGCAIVVLLLQAAYAVADFPWHAFAFVSMTAFVCGILASPFPYQGESTLDNPSGLVRVRAQKNLGKFMVSGFILVLGGVAVWLGMKLYIPWKTQWEYNALCKSSEDPYAHKRRACIARLLPQYPCPALMDTYYMLPPYQTNWAERERLLKIALAGNPRQLFTLTLLVDALGKQGKYAEAESLMRENYAGDCMRGTMLTNWPAFYTLNLLMWAREDMRNSRFASALSKFEYAMCINSWRRTDFNLPYWGKDMPWKEHGGIKPWLPGFIKSCQRDVRLLRMLGVQPDDAWQQPMTPGGHPSLYRAVVEKARQTNIKKPQK